LFSFVHFAVALCSLGFAGLRLFPRLGIPTANTDGIIVSVAVLFVPTDSSPGEHLFTYSIRIRGASDLKFTARLATREWRIKKGLAGVIIIIFFGVFKIVPRTN
jgi:uncharacterized protein affecting Mg2+/Co2+ transport